MNTEKCFRYPANKTQGALVSRLPGHVTCYYVTNIDTQSVNKICTILQTCVNIFRLPRTEAAFREIHTLTYTLHITAK